MQDPINAQAIELVFDRACPNVERARQMIRAALTELGYDAAWVEWDRDDAGTPLDRSHFGSPTVLVNGRDVSPANGQGEGHAADANSCRLYLDDSGSTCGAPPVTLIAAALQRSGMNG